MNKEDSKENLKEKMDEITQRLDQGILEIFESDNFRNYLITMSKLYDYSFSGSIDEIFINNDMIQSQNAKKSIYEMAHTELHSTEESVIKDRSTKEFEAESVAYTVCQHYGIDTSDYSFSYLAAWSQDKELTQLKGSLDIIQKTALQLIETIDKNYRELTKEAVEVDNEKITHQTSIKDRIAIVQEISEKNQNKDERSKNKNVSMYI